MAPLQLNESDTLQLIKILNEYGEKALLIKNIIQLSSPKPKNYLLEVWVDAWPNFNAVLVIYDWTVTEITHISYTYYEFSLKEESLLKLLQTPGIVRSSSIKFPAILSERKSVVEEYMKSKDKCVKKCDMYNLYHLDENSLQSSVAPTNLDIGVLTTEHLDDIADTWEQSSTDQVDSTKEYINVLINTFPNVCLCNSIEKVVAYGLGTDSGTIGYLHVNANYRGRGCTKAVISMLSAKFIEAGITPSVKIQPENILSISVHEQIGYQSSGIVVYDMEF